MLWPSAAQPSARKAWRAPSEGDDHAGASWGHICFTAGLTHFSEEGKGGGQQASAGGTGLRDASPSLPSSQNPSGSRGKRAHHSEAGQRPGPRSCTGQPTRLRLQPQHLARALPAPTGRWHRKAGSGHPSPAAGTICRALSSRRNHPGNRRHLRPLLQRRPDLLHPREPTTSNHPANRRYMLWPRYRELSRSL